MIKKSFQYENEYLKNQANPNITSKNFKLSLDEQEGEKILNKEGIYCFSYVFNKEGKKNTNGYLLLFAGLSLILTLLLIFTIKSTKRRVYGISLWLISLYFLSISGFITSNLLAPKLFAYNEFVPNLFTMGVVIASLAFVLLGLSYLPITKNKEGLFWKPFVLIGVWWFVEGIIPFVLNHSSVPIGLDNLFELKAYSYVLIALFVLLFLCNQIPFLFSYLVNNRKKRLWNLIHL